MSRLLVEDFDDGLWSKLSADYRNIDSTNQEERKEFIRKRALPELYKITKQQDKVKGLLIYVVKYLNNPNKYEPVLQYLLGSESFPDINRHWDRMQVIAEYLEKYDVLDWTQDCWHEESLYTRPKEDFEKTMQLVSEYSTEGTTHTAVEFLDDSKKGLLPLEEIEKKIRGWKHNRMNTPGGYMGLVDAYNKVKGRDAQTSFIKNRVLKLPEFSRHPALRSILIDSIRELGLDKNDNAFIRLVDKLKFNADNYKTHKPMFRYLYEAYMNKKLDLGMEIWANQSLYDRTIQEFKYTANAFVMFSDPKKSGVYLKDLSVVNIEQFMDGDRVKPAGKRGDTTADTIWGTIHMWSEGNEYTADERDAMTGTKSYSEKAIGSIIPKASHDYESFVKIINEYYEGDNTAVKDYLMEVIYTAFKLPEVNKQIVSLSGKSLGAEPETDKSVKSNQQILRSLMGATTDKRVDPAKMKSFEWIDGSPVILGLGSNILYLTKESGGKHENLLQGKMQTVDKLTGSLLSLEVEVGDKKDKVATLKKAVAELAEYSSTNTVKAMMNEIWD